MATLSSPTLGKLITDVRNFLNQPNASNSFWTDQELTEYINDGIRLYFTEVAQANEGYFLSPATDLDITANVEGIALPTDCFELRTVHKKVTNGYEILEYRNNVTDSFTTIGGNNSLTYRPYYFFQGNNLILRPTPNFSETAGLRIYYIQFPETLVTGGGTMTANVSPIFKELIQMYAVFKAKMKESLVNGVVVHAVAESHVGKLYVLFKEAIALRSKSPQFQVAFNPEEGT